MPSMTAKTEDRSYTGLTTGCSTSGAWRLLQRRRPSSETSCFLMTRCALSGSTEQIMQHGMNCLCQGCDNSAWPKRLKSCISLYLESLTRNHTLRLRVRTYRQLTTSPTRVVHSQEWFISILKSTTGLLRPASPSEDSVRMSGNR